MTFPSPSPIPIEEGEQPAGLTDEVQLQAVRLYLHTGSLAEVSRQLAVPVYQLQKLARTQWWMQEMRLLRTIEQAVLDTSLTQLLDMSLEELKHRIQFGEEYTDKDGNTRTRMLSASSLCRITETVFDKRQLIRGLPTAVSQESGKLQELAEKLEAIGKQQAARTVDMDEPETLQSKAGGSADFDID